MSLMSVNCRVYESYQVKTKIYFNTKYMQVYRLETKTTIK